MVGAGPEDRFFFLHMQKTAGTALWQRLLASFPRESLYPTEGDGPKSENTILVKHVVDAWNRRGDEIRVFTGHFPLCTTELLGGGFRTFTVLREPVERTLSSLRHYRTKTPGMAEVPLEEIYEDPWRQLLTRNHMVKMLSLTVEEMSGDLLTDVEFTDERLERAKHALAGIDVVGIQERFEEFGAALEATFGWDLGPSRIANRTTAVTVDDGFRRRIAEDQAHDIALYEYGCTLAAG